MGAQGFTRTDVIVIIWRNWDRVRVMATSKNLKKVLSTR